MKSDMLTPGKIMRVYAISEIRSDKISAKVWSVLSVLMQRGYGGDCAVIGEAESDFAIVLVITGENIRGRRKRHGLSPAPPVPIARRGS